MVKKRRKAKTVAQKNQDEKGKRFIWTLLIVVAIFVLGFIALRTLL